MWLIITSISPSSAMGKYPPDLFPTHPTFSNYKDAFTSYSIGDFLLNSVIVDTASTALVVCLGSCAAYALARTRMRGKLSILVALLIVSTFPIVTVVAPLYAIFRALGLLDSYQALIIPYTALHLPFAIWLMRNYFITIPFEMEESGQVDGASALRIIVQLIVPQAVPGIFVAATLTFAACWQEFLLSLSFNPVPGHQTVPVGINLMTGYAGSVPYETVFAASVVALLPIVILVIGMRKWVIGGIGSGAVKG
jgi:multiple sugar transport system permease protein